MPGHGGDALFSEMKAQKIHQRFYQLKFKQIVSITPFREPCLVKWATESGMNTERLWWFLVTFFFRVVNDLILSKTFFCLSHEEWQRPNYWWGRGVKEAGKTDVLTQINSLVLPYRSEAKPAFTYLSPTEIKSPEQGHGLYLVNNV